MNPPDAPSDERPDPDRLLAAVEAADARARRGRLRIFFGASAGVGKTFAMLELARSARASGTDVVVGYVEPHGRKDTEALLAGLEQLPTLAVRYRGLTRQEFDLEAALRRRPALLLVDELAHSNLIDGDPPPRHAKRWQDIDELRDAGIDVWTTLNVQHLESLNDVVAGITGIRQQETVPDHVFDEADEVELVDLPADDLLERLRLGKIYVPKHALVATERFFRKGNLIALRELALRRTADRVDAAARELGARDRALRPWLARDRLIAAIGPDARADTVIRAAKRLADALDAEWTAVFVETPALRRMSEAQRNRRIELLRLAGSLGAETVTLDGPTVVDALVEYAATRRATRLVVGASRSRWRALGGRSVASRLAARVRGTDVVVITSEPAARPSRGDPPPGAAVEARSAHPERYVAALLASAVCTGIAFVLYPAVGLVNLVMVYVLGSSIVGLRFGRGPAVLAAVVNVLAFDVCFVPPRFSLAVSDVEYLLTFGVMLIVSLTIAQLMASVRQQTRVAGARERRTALLYAMGRELASTRGIAEMAAVGQRHVAEVFDAATAVLLPRADGEPEVVASGGDAQSAFVPDLSIARWVSARGRDAGLGSDTLPGAAAVYVPLPGGDGPCGVLVVRPANPRRVLLPEQRALLDTFAGTLGLALARARLAEQAESARVAAETEGLRNTLLASISHDLRTPLAAIAAAAGTLASRDIGGDEARRVDLARSIETGALQMTETITDLLDLSRLEAGAVNLRCEPESVAELVEVAVAGLGPRLADHPLRIELPDDLPLLQVDGSLIVRVLHNLLANAASHTPPGTTVTLRAEAVAGGLRLSVIDDGPGLPPGDPDALFRKFHRGHGESSVPGVGLGLAICREIVRAHGGDIVAERRDPGAAFHVTLPTATPDAARPDAQDTA